MNTFYGVPPRNSLSNDKLSQIREIKESIGILPQRNVSHESTQIGFFTPTNPECLDIRVLINFFLLGILLLYLVYGYENGILNERRNVLLGECANKYGNATLSRQHFFND